MTIVKANWQAKSHVTALSTTRLGGASKPPYDSNNLALHVGDDSDQVIQNRQQLQQDLHLPAPPIWLQQTHSTDCIIAEEDSNRTADAAITRQANTPLVIMTADCLPIVLCDVAGTEIAAIHAGWKGLCQGIIENTLNKMVNKPHNLMAWIGPAICADCYTVGEEMRQSFLQHCPEAAAFFTPQQPGFQANLPAIAALLLKNCGLPVVHLSGLCTFEAQDSFYSYRRTATTGRIGTFIWFNSH